MRSIVPLDSQARPRAERMEAMAMTKSEWKTVSSLMQDKLDRLSYKEGGFDGYDMADMLAMLKLCKHGKHTLYPYLAQSIFSVVKSHGPEELDSDAFTGKYAEELKADNEKAHVLYTEFMELVNEWAERWPVFGECIQDVIDELEV